MGDTETPSYSAKSRISGKASNPFYVRIFCSGWGDLGIQNFVDELTEPGFLFPYNTKMHGKQKEPETACMLVPPTGDSLTPTLYQRHQHAF